MSMCACPKSGRMPPVVMDPPTTQSSAARMAAKSAASLSTLEGALLVLDAGGQPTGVAQIYTTTPTPVAL